MPAPPSPEQKKILDEREKCRRDKLYLADALGYDFVAEVHQELFDQYMKYDRAKPWALQSEITKKLVLWPRGHFKDLDVETLIPTPTGFVRMGDLVVGDRVFSDSGEVCTVVGVSPVFTDHVCYDVEFSTGEHIVAGEDHQWLTDAHTDIRHAAGTGVYDPITQKTFRRKRKRRPSVKTTRQIFDSVCYGNKNHNHSVRIAKPLALPKADLPIPPYVLGAWLGDGTSSCANITGVDLQIFQGIAEEGQAIKQSPCDPQRWCMTGDGLQSKLRSLELLNNKHIPEVYLRASHQQRLSLLQGLMDTGGSCSKSGQCSFTGTNRRLVEGCRELVASLGLKPSVIGIYDSYVGRAENKTAIGEAANVFSFYAYSDTPVFRLQRKLDRLPARKPLSLQNNRQIVSVTRVETRPTKCIAVDAPSRLFLVGNGFIPTHNTSSVVVEIIQAILNFPDIRILIMQGSKITTRNLLHEIKAHFTGQNSKSRLTQLFPEFCETEEKMGTVDHFTTPARKNMGLAQATVTVASPKSVKTGQHYDIGFFDDLVNDQNYQSQRLLAKVRGDFYMCMPLLDPPYYAVVTGTRYAFGDLYEEIMRANKGEWLVSLKTCWKEDGTPRFPQHVTPDNRIVGFTKEGLLALQAADPMMFSSQYLNIPIQKGGKRFTKEMLNACMILPADSPALGPATFFIDLASTEATYSDDSVVICAKTDSLGNYYVVDARGGQWPPGTLAQTIIEMSLTHRPVRIFMEGTASCIYFEAFLTQMARSKGIVLPTEKLKVNNKDDAKAIRIGALEVYLKSKRLKFFVGLAAWPKIIEQFEQFSPGQRRHDDYPDTIALMVQKFSEQKTFAPYVRVNKNPIIALMEQIERTQDVSHVMTDERSDGLDGFRF